ncbi:MAG: sialate O-acetylesterase [Bacilli bacterium]|nr:sialate O-acetylesterase [Bacilli bacterium]
MNKKLLLTIMSAAVVSLAACNLEATPDKPNPPAPTPSVEYVPVFVMSGQSNMEGSSNWRLNNNNLLKEAMTELGEDYSVVDPDETNNTIAQKGERNDGIENVLTSYYGFYHPNGWTQAHTSSMDTSTPEARLTPNFKPTTVGMGVSDGGNDDFFGPELGMAYKLSKNYDGDEPIHLIKAAFSGSGFSQGTVNWRNYPDEAKTDEQNATSSLYYLLKRYTDNCLKVIEDQGKVPVIKGFIWHQGESDTGNNNYQTEMEGLISRFRTDYAEYATDGEGKNIAFLDCTIYDGSKNKYGSQESVNNGINAKKNAIAAKGKLDKDDDNYEPNFIVDGTFTDHGLKLEIGDAAKGGYNQYHYNTKDAFILGEAYADLILENGLLD